MTNIKTHSITFCIATKNRPAKLRQAIDKILKAYLFLQQINANHLSVTISIVDSSDRPDTQLNDFLKISSRELGITVTYHYDSSLGLDDAYQLAINNSNTEYTWLLSDDDLILEDALARLDQIISGEPNNLDLIILNSSQVDQFARFELSKKRIQVQSDKYYKWSQIDSTIRLQLFGYLCLISCIIFRRDLYIIPLTIDDEDFKYFTHATNIMSGLDEFSIIQLVSTPCLQVRQGPASWIKHYTRVYDICLPTCIKYITRHGNQMYHLHVKNSRKKGIKSSIIHNIRKCVYSDKLLYQARKTIALTLGLFLFLAFKTSKKQSVSLVAYEFISYASQLMPIILWNKSYRVALLDLRHSHRNTGIGKFQKQFPSLFKHHCNDKTLLTLATQRSIRKNNHLTSAVDLTVPMPNYLLSEVFYLPILQAFLRPLICIYTANTSPFFLVGGNYYRILHDTIYIDRLKDQILNSFSLSSFKTMLAELYMSINVTLGDRFLQVNTICISNTTRQSAKRLGMKTTDFTLPTFIPRDISKISSKRKPDHKNAQYILHFASCDPRKNTIRALQAYSQYCIEKLMHGHEPLTLRLVGPFTLEQTSNIINKCTTPGHAPRVLGFVDVCGLVSEDMLSDIYYQSMLLLYPSENEGFGIPICEAWQYATIPLIIPVASLAEFPATAVFHIKSLSTYDIKEAIIAAENLTDQEKEQYTTNGLLYINTLQSIQSSTIKWLLSSI